jgi:hypothetical protein
MKQIKLENCKKRFSVAITLNPYEANGEATAQVATPNVRLTEEALRSNNH